MKDNTSCPAPGNFRGDSSGLPTTTRIRIVILHNQWLQGGGVGGERSFARKSSVPSDTRSNFAFGLTPTAWYIAITFEQNPGNKDNRGSGPPENERGVQCGNKLLLRTAKSVGSDTQQTLPPLSIILYCALNRSRDLYNATGP